MSTEPQVGDLIDVVIKRVPITHIEPAIPGSFGPFVYVAVPAMHGAENSTLIWPNSPAVTITVVKPVVAPVSTGPKVDDTGHVAAICNNPECNGCNFCAGGLWACDVCNGAEGSMPSTCPGARMTHEQSDAVYAGRLDFRDGRWFEGMASRFCPAGMAAEAGR